MAWYGIGKKTRFKNMVLADMRHLLNSYGTEAIGGDGELLKRLNAESAAAGQRSDQTFIDLLLSIFIHAIDENLDVMVSKKLIPRQGSLYCFSSYIFNAYKSESLDLKGEDRCITTALASIWFICLHHLEQRYEESKDVVIGKHIDPFKNISPFNELGHKTYE